MDWNCYRKQWVLFLAPTEQIETGFFLDNPWVLFLAPTEQIEGNGASFGWAPRYVSKVRVTGHPRGSAAGYLGPCGSVPF